MTFRARNSRMLALPSVALILIAVLVFCMRGAGDDGLDEPLRANGEIGESAPQIVRSGPNTEGEVALARSPTADSLADPIDREVVIAETADVLFEARVRDTHEDPVSGVSITLRLDLSHFDVRVETDDEGRARFTRRALRDMLDAADENSRFVVYATVRRTVPDRLLLSRGELGTTVPEFEVEARARVQVEVTCGGEPLASRVRVELERVTSREDRNAERFSIAEATTTTGRVNFSGIDPEIDVVATARFDDAVGNSDLDAPVRTRLAAPVKLKIDLTPVPHLRMRLLDRRREPVRSCLFEILRTDIRAAAPLAFRPTIERISTDDDGRLRCTLKSRDPAVAADRKPRWIFLTCGTGRDRRGIDIDVQRFADSPGTADLDMGDLVLRDVEPLASGVVTRPDGTPFAGAKVALEFDPPSSASDRPRDAGTTAISDNVGSFEIFGYDSSRRFSLVATNPSYAPSATLHCARPTTGVVLHLQELGSIAGSIALQSALLRRASVQVRLHRDDRTRKAGFAADASTEVRRCRPAASGAFSIANLMPGSWDLVLTVGDLGVVAEVTNIVVAPNGVAHDPRLVDLGAQLPLSQIEILTTDGGTGKSVDAWITVRSDSSNPWDDGRPQGLALGGFEESSFASKRFWIRTDVGATVTIRASGFATVTLDGVRESRTVALERVGIRRLKLLGWPSESRSPLCLALVALDENGQEREGGLRRMDARVSTIDNGVAMFDDLGPGHYRAHWTRAIVPAVAVDSGVDLTIPGGEAPLEITLVPPSAVLELARKKR